MRKCLVTCWIAILFILLLTDESLCRRSFSRSSSSRSRGGSRPSSSSSRPSGGRKPSGGSRPDSSSHSKPGSSKPGSSFPSSPDLSKPSFLFPIRPGSSKPGSIPMKPGSLPASPVDPPYNPAYQPPKPPPYKPQNPAKPPQNPAHPPPYHPQNPAHPPPPYQPQNPAHPPPPYQPQNPAHPPPPYQPQNPAHPPPPYQPQNPAHPPPPYQPQNPAHPPPYKPQNPVYPPQNPGRPQNPAYPSQYPQHNPVYPPQKPNYPQNPPWYPGHAPQYPGIPSHPGYPANPGFPSHTGGGHWAHYDSKPWKPKKPKTKHLVGSAVAGAAAGAIGGYLLGNAMSNLRFRFDNPFEERWWYENRNRYPDQVYYPQYNQPVLRDVFLRDCVNVTVREYVEPTGNQTADELETKIVTRVVHEMCTEQYRLVSGAAGGGSWSHYESEPWKPKTPKSEMPQVTEKTVTSTPKGAIVGPLLGSPMSNMTFQFNNSDEERWWYENRNNYSDQVYYLEYSQPVSQDIFVSDCMNITLEKFLEPTGNQTVDEMEERVVRQVVHKMCTGQYRLVSGVAGGGPWSHDAREPGNSKTAYVEEEAAAYVTVAVIGSNLFENGPAHAGFNKADPKVPGSGIAMLLANPSLLWITTFTFCFLMH